MKTIRTRTDIQTVVGEWKSGGSYIGFVPTMGALHAGHMALVKQAMAHADRVVVSIFINPAQFAPHEDLKSYPRDEPGDLEKLEKAGVQAVYIPSVQEIYPNGVKDSIKDRVPLGAAAKGLDADFRPDFFSGVAAAVSRLFDHVRPDMAVFGEKDFQQLQVIRDMIEHLEHPVEIISAPVVRDEHGLALSSRNMYLSPENLAVARRLNVILREVKSMVSRSGEPDQTAEILQHAKSLLLQAGFDQVEYVALRWDRILAAVWAGQTRLIDNMSCGFAEHE